MENQQSGYLPKLENLVEPRPVNENEIHLFNDYTYDSRIYSTVEEPHEWISLLIASYNTRMEYLNECIDSIKGQRGNFGIEIVWISDGSNENFNRYLESLLFNLHNTKNTKVVYKKLGMNMGLPYCLNRGLLLCSNEIVFRMDSDDVMREDRIQRQLQFIKNTPNCVVCGSNIEIFGQEINTHSSTHPPFLTWNQYIQNKSTWFMNHPTLCFKRSAVLSVGNYITRRVPFEDLELELRLLKKYGVVFCLQDNLLRYRIHNEQICQRSNHLQDLFVPMKNEMIDSIIYTPFEKPLLPVNLNELKVFRFTDNCCLEEYTPPHILNP